MGSGGPAASFDINKIFKNQPPPGYNPGPSPQIPHPPPGHPYNNFHPNSFVPPNLYGSPTPATYANVPPYPFGPQGPIYNQYQPYPQEQMLQSSQYPSSGFVQHGFSLPVATSSSNSVSNDVLSNVNSSTGSALDSARLMALLTNHSSSGSLSGSTSVEPQLADSKSSDSHVEASNAPGAVAPAVPSAPPISLAPTIKGRISSGKIPKGRRLKGEHVIYDIDVRSAGEAQPQLEVSPITMYGSDPQLVVGRQIAVNKNYICYGLRPNRHIRILNRHTALRHLLRGHSERVTDMAFYADDVHLLASASSDGIVFVRKIVEGPDHDGKVQIKDQILLGIQLSGEWKSVHPCVCWHNHTQDLLVVGISKFVITVDIKKVRQSGAIDDFSAEEPILCSVDSPIEGVSCVSQENDITDLSSSPSNILVSASLDGTVCFWRDNELQPFSTLVPHEGLPVGAAAFLSAPHHADHIVLLTAGPLNRELKLWAPDIGEGWFPASGSVKWKCIQTLELKSSCTGAFPDAFFIQVHAVPKARVILLPNAKRNALYVVHLDFGLNPSSTSFDYLAEFSVTMPILSLTATSENAFDGNGIVQVYCVQTQAIQQYSLDLALCVPPLDIGNNTTDIEASCRTLDGQAGNITTDNITSTLTVDVTEIVRTEAMTPVSSVTLTDKSLEGEAALPCLDDPSITSGSSGILADASENIAPSANVETAGLILSSSLKSSVEGSSPIEKMENTCKPEQLEEITDELGMTSHGINLFSTQRNLSDSLKVNEDRDWQVISTSTASSVMLEHQNGTGSMHLITPSELMSMVARLKVESNEGLSDSPPGETKHLTRVEDYIEKMDLEVLTIETKEVTESSVLYPDSMENEITQKIVEDSWERDLNDYGNLDYTKKEHEFGEEHQRCADGETTDDLLSGAPRIDDSNEQEAGEFSVKVDDLSTLSMASQTRKKKNKNKTDVVPAVATYSNTQMGSTSSSMMRTSEANLSNNLANNVPSAVIVAQVNAVQESLNQLLTMQRECQKQIGSIIAAPISKEVKRVEVSLGQRIEKLLKAHTDAIWARVQEDGARCEKLERDNADQLVSTLSNLLNKELPAALERSLKKELSTLGPSVSRIVTPSIEKMISTAVNEAFQKGVSEKGISQLDKSIGARVEALVSKQLQLQFQTSGKQALQEGLRSSFEGTVIPAFERACQVMFGQVDAAFQNGIVEHQLHTQQQLITSQSSLTASLQETLGAASLLANTLKADLADGQRKLLALVENPGVIHGANPASSSLPEKAMMVQHVEESLDPTKELARLISERKLEEAFNKALSLTDVGVVSWLCNQVDPASIFTMSPIPLSQGVLLALVQQLGCDLGNDTAKKLAWIKDASLALNPQDPGLAPHMRHFLEKLYGNLHALANTNLNSDLAKTTRLVMYVVHSLLSICNDAMV